MPRAWRDRHISFLNLALSQDRTETLEIRPVPKFNVTVPHSLSQEDAKAKLERFAESLEAKFKDKVSDLSQQWEGNCLSFAFKTFGIKISGKIDVNPNDLSVSGDIPITAMPFKGKIESDIREQLERLMR
jgi:hypothetical protein